MFKAKKVSAALIAAVVLGSLISPSATAAPKNQARAVVQADWLEKNLDNLLYKCFSYPEDVLQEWKEYI